MKKKILFIINPISGGKKKDQVPALIAQYLDQDIFEYRIIFTEAPKQAHIIAGDNIDTTDIIIAVGGDGTVNEIAAVLAGTDKIFGILPYGSGNGLSRFLDVPMDAALAVKNLNYLNIQTIDAGKFNGRWFFNMAGMGFDAHISEVFSHQEKRGFVTYVKSSFTEVIKYKAQNYLIDIDGKEYRHDAFMLSFANSSQYGNNAHVSPTASVQDGLLDVCVIKPFPLYRFIEMGLRMFFKTAPASKFVEIIKGKNIKVTRPGNGPIHIDGEPIMAGHELEIKVIPGALRVIVGKNYIKDHGEE